MRSTMAHVEHKEPVERRWRTEKGIQVDDNLGRQCCGASGMKDAKVGIIVHDQGVLQKWLRTVRAPFVQTPNPCRSALFIIDDEQVVSLLTPEMLSSHAFLIDRTLVNNQCREWQQRVQNGLLVWTPQWRKGSGFSREVDESGACPLEKRLLTASQHPLP
jgi:hypothetical protein